MSMVRNTLLVFVGMLVGYVICLHVFIPRLLAQVPPGCTLPAMPERVVVRPKHGRPRELQGRLECIHNTITVSQ